MNRNVRRALALALISAWMFGFAAPAVDAQMVAAAGGRLTGVVTGAGNHPGAGYQVMLLNEGWDLVARTSTAADGSYAFDGVGAGSYRLGVADPAGHLAPVAGTRARVEPGGNSVVRIRVTDAERGVRLAPASYGPKANSWWDRQTRGQKIFWISAAAVGAGAVAWGVSELLKDDDETPASPY